MSGYRILVQERFYNTIKIKEYVLMTANENYRIEQLLKRILAILVKLEEKYLKD